jgi:Xaa-Pro aminopeptidase
MKLSRYFPQAEYEARWERAHAEMNRRGIETVVVWSRSGGTYDRCADVLYLTNYYSSASGQETDNPLNRARSFAAVILEAGETPELHIDGPDDRNHLIATDRMAWHHDPIKGVADALNERNITGPVAFVGTDFFPVKYWQALSDATPKIDWRPADDLVQTLRRIKSPRELDCFREAGAIATRVLDILMTGLVGGKTEAEAVADAVHEIIRSGGACQMIPVAHGEEIGYWCTNPLTGCSTERPAKGDLVRGWVDSIIYQGYWLDPGRTAVAGRSPRPEQQELLEACIGIVEGVIEAVRPGASVLEVARLGDRLSDAVRVGQDQMSDQWPLYGHGTGLYWEHPYIGTTMCDPEAVFEAGMVLGIEAFLSHEGVGTAAFEQNLIVGAEGNELLIHAPMLGW